ncbi:MAG TPA: heme o synthase [Candidatus Binatia bacterium]|nr:heme o synthase [Candidatus Binatia bacterium]
MQKDGLLKKYYNLAKPERTYANVLTTTAGFLLASKWHINFKLLVATLVGTSFVIGSACVVNNFTDRKIDAKMSRTSRRALVNHEVSPVLALIYGVVLGIIGFGALSLFVNKLVVILGAVAYFDYVVLYGLAKRHTVHSTLIGTLSGAMPITAGYCAVTGHIDAGAILVYLIMTFWQMPHFYAIAIYRLKDYAAAGLPIMSVKRGVKSTKKQLLTYMLGFIVVSLLPSLLGYTGQIYFIVMLAVDLVWLKVGLSGLRAKDDAHWAKETFLFSLIVLLVFVTMLAVDPSLA